MSTCRRSLRRRDFGGSTESARHRAALHSYLPLLCSLYGNFATCVDDALRPTHRIPLPLFDSLTIETRDAERIKLRGNLRGLRAREHIAIHYVAR